MAKKKQWLGQLLEAARRELKPEDSNSRDIDVHISGNVAYILYDGETLPRPARTDFRGRGRW